MTQQFVRKAKNYFLIDPDITTNHGDGSIRGSIQWAIDQILANGSGGTVELVDGTYNLEEHLSISNLNQNIEIIGSGENCILYLDQNSVDDYMIQLTTSGYYFLTLRNFKFTGAAAGGSKAIIYCGEAQCNQIRFERLYCNTASDGFFEFTTCYLLDMRNCKFGYEDSPAFTGKVLAGTITCGFIGDNYAYATDFILGGLIETVVMGNEFYSTTNNCIASLGDENIISNNLFESKSNLLTTTGIIHVIGHRNNIIGNTFDGNDTDCNCVYVDATYDYNNIQGNIFKDTTQYGVVIAAVSCSYNTILLNHCYDVDLGCYSDSGTLTVIISYNENTDRWNTRPVLGGSCYSELVHTNVDYTVSSDDHAIFCDDSTTSLTITLYQVSSADGMIKIAKETGGENTVTIVPFAGDSIEGADSIVLTNQYDTVNLGTDGVNMWYQF